MHSLCWGAYYSQFGQDRYIYTKFFKNFRNGVFLDIGAHNGITFSNTYFFEKELGWSGICLEPIPEVFDQLEKNRDCICICGCASHEHHTKKDFLRIFGYPEMLSGLIDEFDPKHLVRIERELKNNGGSYEVIQVTCYNLNRVLEEAGITHVHLMSLDTEGGEFEILQNFDFSKCHVDVITVEDNYRKHPFISFLKSQGFRFFMRLKQDLIFVNQSFRSL